MIPANAPTTQPAGWQAQWRDAVRDPQELLGLLGLSRLSGSLSARAAGEFPLRVPHHFIGRMRHGDPADPLLRQVLPLAAEDVRVEGFGLDAVGDLDANPASGVLHKYQGRALLVSTGSCAVHCRYCFRRHFPYAEQTAAANDWSGALSYLRNRSDVEEVLLSGGDPLSLSTRKLADFTRQLDRLPQVRRVRLHTRLPVVLPARVDDELLAWLSGIGQQLVVVVHANHPREIDADVDAALRALHAVGATVFNQAVLLAGVNDDASVLAELSERLFAARALPYYVHQLDRVAGVAHFEVTDVRARAIESELRERLPGYLVPRFVREVAGAPNKLPM